MKSFIFALLAMTFTQSVFAAKSPIKSVGNGRYEVQICSLNGRELPDDAEWVIFTSAGVEISTGYTVEGCVITTLPAKAGDKWIVQVQMSSGTIAKQNFTIPGGGTSTDPDETDPHLPPVLPDPEWDSNAAITVAVKQGRLSVQGSHIIANYKKSYTAQIHVNGSNIGSEPVAKTGTFRFTADGVAYGADTVKVVVADYKGDALDLELTQKIPYWVNEDAAVTFGDLQDGQLTVRGTDFQHNMGDNVNVTISVDGASKLIQASRSGTFTAKVSVSQGSTVVVSVPDYFGGRSFSKSYQVPLLYNRAAAITWGSYVNGQVSVSGTGIQRYDGRALYAEVWLRRTGSSDTRLTRQQVRTDGRFTFTTVQGDVLCGDRLIVVVADYKDVGSDFTEDAALPAHGREGCFNWIPETKIRNRAQNEADEAVTRVWNTFGAREIYRANFVSGFWSALNANEAGDAGRFNQGYTKGSADARAPGRAAGEQAANERALGLATTEAYSRFAAVAASGSNPDLTVSVPATTFAGFAAGDIYGFDVQAELAALARRNSSELDRRWLRGGLEIQLSSRQNPFTLTDVYALRSASGYTINTAWMSGSWAFEGWAKDDLGNPFDQTMYDNLSPEQRRDFRDYFENAFQNAMQRNVNSLRGSDFEAVTLGQRLGGELGSTLAYNRGLTQGYRDGFEQAAVRSANDQFGHAYKQEFNTSTAYLRAATENAQTAATRVVQTYGRREIFRRDFQAGFKTKLAEPLVDNSAYVTGMQIGAADAVREGREAGAAQALSQSQALVPSDVRERFVEATVTGTRLPNLDTNREAPAYAGDAAVRTEVNVRDELTRLAGELSTESSTISFTNGGVTANLTGGDALNLISIYNGGLPVDYSPRLSYLSGEFGLQEWRAQRLGTLSYGIGTALNGAHRRNYEALFSLVYASRAQSAFAQVAGVQDFNARDLGGRYGSNLNNAKAQAQGRVDGFNRDYRAASIAGYHAEFPGIYAGRFLEEARIYQQNPVVVVNSINLIDGNGNGYFEASETVGVQVNGVMNIGMVDASNIAYALSGNSLTSKGTIPARVDIPALTNAGDLRLANLATIARNARDGAAYQANFAFAGKNNTLNYRIGWLALVDQFAATDDESMREAILLVLKADWEKRWKNKGWLTSSSGFALSQLVSYYQRLPRDAGGTTKRQRLKALHGDIVAIVANESGKNKNKFVQAANGLLN